MNTANKNKGLHFLPYFTHKIKTLFWTPSKMGVLKYLTFVSQINVMWQKIKHKNCTKMIKFILKILVTGRKEYIICFSYVTDQKPNKKGTQVHFFCWMKFRLTGCRTWGTRGKFGLGCTTEPDGRNRTGAGYRGAPLHGNTNNGPSGVTLCQEGFSRGVSSAALLDQVLGHPVGPGWRQAVLGGFVVLPQPRTLAHTDKLSRVARLCGDKQKGAFTRAGLHL